jgi:hypothetical protein
MRTNIKENLMSFNDQIRSNVAVSDLKLVTRNIIGVFLMLTLSLLLIVAILIPNMIGLTASAVSSHSFSEWGVVFAGILLMGFLIVAPVILLIQSSVEYRNIRALSRFGLMTKGSIVDKWVESSDGKPVYHVHYTYLSHFTAVQIVDKVVFEELKYNETIFVLHLEHAPHISCLDLD